jgi:hypothetical protein
MSGKLTDEQHDWLSRFLEKRPGAPPLAPSAGSAPVVAFNAPWPPTPMGPFDPPPDPLDQSPPTPSPTPSPSPSPPPAPAAPAVSVQEVPITANSVDEFVRLANAAIGGRLLGETRPTFSSVGSELVPSGDKLAKVVLTLTINVRFATFGGGRPDANNSSAIKELAALLKAHEERHRDDCLAAWTTWDAAKTISTLMARTFKGAQDAGAALDAELQRLATLVNDACLKLHSREGVYTPKHNRDGTITIAVTPAGASGC